MSAASWRLYLHRSTLVEQIERIKKELAVDLKNPGQRLQLQILLKVLDLEKGRKAKQMRPLPIGSGLCIALPAQWEQALRSASVSSAWTATSADSG